MLIISNKYNAYYTSNWRRPKYKNKNTRKHLQEKLTNHQPYMGINVPTFVSQIVIVLYSVVYSK